MGLVPIRLETEAKLYLQAQIKSQHLELVWSYILEFENDNNPFKEKRLAIAQWEALSTVTVGESESLLVRAESFLNKGIKAKDALHVSCAITGNADYFVSTDDKLLNKLSGNKEIKAVNPIDIVGEIDGYLNRHRD